jgi:hypothetical protein
VRSRLPAPGSRLPAPGSRLPAPGSRLPAPGSLELSAVVLAPFHVERGAHGAFHLSVEEGPIRSCVDGPRRCVSLIGFPGQIDAGAQGHQIRGSGFPSSEDWRVRHRRAISWIARAKSAKSAGRGRAQPRRVNGTDSAAPTPFTRRGCPPLRALARCLVDENFQTTRDPGNRRISYPMDRPATPRIHTHEAHCVNRRTPRS